MNKFLLLFCAFLFLNANLGNALTTTWTGAASDGDWSNATNWNNGVPGPMDEAEFNIDATVTTATGTPQISRLKIFGGSARVIVLNINLDINGKGIDDRALQVNAGQLTLGAGHVFNVEGPTGKDGVYTNNANGILTVDGTLNVTATDDDGINVNSGLITNNGTITLDGGANDVRTLLINNGTLNNNGTLTFIGGKQFFRAQINTGGTLTNNKGGIIDLENGRLKVSYSNPDNGTLTNNGYITSSINVGIRTDAGGGANITNGGFYKFSTSTNNFADDGTNPAGADNGFDVNSDAIDAGGANDIDFSTTSSGMEIYTWTGPSMTRDNMDSGTLDLTGFEFPNQAGPHNITLDVPAYNALFTIQVSNLGEGAALPIELMYFRANAKGDKVSIEWQTAVELNNDYMVVERSSDGRNFTAVEKVRGQGNSTALNDYEVIDNNPFAGVNYYRLHQVDFDGREDYSDIVQVKIENGTSTSLVVYPSVLNNTNTLNVDLTNAKNETILFDVFNFNGQLVETISLQGSTLATFQTRNLQNGMYVLQSRNAESILSTRFVIAR